LSEHPDNEVTLLESGPGGRSDDSASFFDAVETPGRVYPDLEVVRVEGHPPGRYTRGRGLGGSSAVNSMIALPGGPFAAEHLIPTAIAPRYEWGAVDRALVAASEDAAAVPLTRRDGRRVSAADAYLEPARGREGLRVIADVHVDRVVLDGRRAIGLLTADGRHLEADRVVVSAGAIHSPAILLRSGVDTPGVGRGLKDHPSAALALHLVAEAVADPSSLAVATVLRRGAAQVLPLNHLGRRAMGYGLLMPALMEVRSAGQVTLADPDPHAHPRVEFRMLSDPADLAGLVAAVELALGLLRHPEFAEIVAAAYVDEHGTTVEALDTPERIAAWLPAHVGDYVHASCSCRMGVVVDDECRVNGYDGLYVCDASVFPDIPPVNTHLPTVMLAETIAARWLSSTGR
jgi:choline dehydrogenase-like flavoprotein